MPQSLTRYDAARDYVRESWQIEGLRLPRRGARVDQAVGMLLWLAEDVSADRIVAYARFCGGTLRSVRDGSRMRVGSHEAPPSGPAVAHALNGLVAKRDQRDAVEWHHAFLHLHPFTDGNGRTARAVWWASRGPLTSFLHDWYYCVLERLDKQVHASICCESST